MASVRDSDPSPRSTASRRRQHGEICVRAWPLEAAQSRSEWSCAGKILAACWGHEPADDAGRSAGRDALVVPVHGAGGGDDAQLRAPGLALERAEAGTPRPPSSVARTAWVRKVVRKSWTVHPGIDVFLRTLRSEPAMLVTWGLFACARDGKTHAPEWPVSPSSLMT